MAAVGPRRCSADAGLGAGGGSGGPNLSSHPSGHTAPSEIGKAPALAHMPPVAGRSLLPDLLPVPPGSVQEPPSPFPAARGTQPPHALPPGDQGSNMSGDRSGGGGGCVGVSRRGSPQLGAQAGWGCRRTILHRPGGAGARGPLLGTPGPEVSWLGQLPQGGPALLPNSWSRFSGPLVDSPRIPQAWHMFPVGHTAQPFLSLHWGPPDPLAALPTSHPWLCCSPHNPAVSLLWLPSAFRVSSHRLASGALRCDAAPFGQALGPPLLARSPRVSPPTGEKEEVPRMIHVLGPRGSRMVPPLSGTLSPCLGAPAPRSVFPAQAGLAPIPVLGRAVCRP